MNKYKIIFFFLINFVIYNYSYSQNIVFADLDKIIKNSDAGKKIIDHFLNENKILLNEFESIKNEIKKKEQALISQKNLLAEDEYSKKIDNLKIEVNNFNSMSNKKLKELNDLKILVSNSFKKEINKVLKEFSEKNKIDLIISSNQILIGKSNIDVTNDLLIIVNKKITKFEIKK